MFVISSSLTVTLGGAAVELGRQLYFQKKESLWHSHNTCWGQAHQSTNALFKTPHFSKKCLQAALKAEPVEKTASPFGSPYAHVLKGPEIGPNRQRGQALALTVTNVRTLGKILKIFETPVSHFKWRER